MCPRMCIFLAPHDDCISRLCCRRLLAFEFAIDDGGLAEVGVLFSSLGIPGVLARASRCDAVLGSLLLAAAFPFSLAFPAAPDGA